MRCPVCNNDNPLKFSDGYMCENCGNLFSEPTPTETRAEKQEHGVPKEKDLLKIKALSTARLKIMLSDYISDDTNNDPEGMFACMLELAYRGDGKAQYLTALSYESGRACEESIPLAPNKEKAFFWLMKAAESGYLPSKIYLEEKYDTEFEKIKAETEEQKEAQLLVRSNINGDMSSIFADALKKTVCIECTGDSDGSSLGTGFILSDGSVITNFHVVDVAFKKDNSYSGVITCIFDESIDSNVYRLVPELCSEKLDIAVLRFTNFIPKDTFKLANSDNAMPGSHVFGIGRDAYSNYNLHFNPGNISRRAQRVNENFDDYLIVAMDVYSGNSGGPIVDEQGKVVGMATASPVLQGSSEVGDFFAKEMRISVSGMAYAVTSRSIKNFINICRRMKKEKRE